MTKGKIIRVRRNTDDVIKYASEKCDRGDYLAALSSLLTELEKHPEKDVVYSHLADIYTELGLYEIAVSLWFKYLLVADKKNYWDAYNGLGANFYFLEENGYATYYFCEQLKSNDSAESVYEDVLIEFMEKANSQNEKDDEIRVIRDKTQEEIDGEKIALGKKLLFENHIDLAMGLFNEVEKDSPLYAKAQYEKAYVYHYLLEHEKAIACIDESIELGYVNVRGLAFAIDLYKTFEKDGVERYIQALVDYKTDDFEEKYRQLTSLCDYGQFIKAKEIADELLLEDEYNANVVYLKAFLLYNEGDFDEAERYFKKAYLLTCSSQALYYLKVAQMAQDGVIPKEKLKISFDLPVGEIERRIDLITDIITGAKNIEDIEFSQIDELVKWCFASKYEDLQRSLAFTLITSAKQKYVYMVKEALVSPTIKDMVKRTMLSDLCLYSNQSKVKIVLSNYFKTVRFYRPDFFEDGKEIFERAYANVFSLLAILDGEAVYRLSVGARELQSEIITAGKVDGVTDEDALACVMYFYSGTNVMKNESAYKVFNTSREAVGQIFKLTETL